MDGFWLLDKWVGGEGEVCAHLPLTTAPPAKRAITPSCLMPSFCIAIPSIVDSADRINFLAGNDFQNESECFCDIRNVHALAAPPNYLAIQSQPVGRIENLNWRKLLHIEISFRFLNKFWELLAILRFP